MISCFHKHIANYKFSMQKVYVAAGLSRQGYYQQLNRNDNEKREEELILNKVRTARITHPRMGARKLFVLLSLQGEIGVNRFERLLSDQGLNVPIRRNAFKTTNSNHPLQKYDNLINGFKLTGINQIWATDITYFIQGEDVYYITFIMDLYSRRVLGYSVSLNMQHIHNLTVLKESIRLRGKIDYGRLIHHSDKGSQFCSNAYINALDSKNISISMAMTSLENAYVERLNGILKNDYLYPRNKVHNLKSLKKELKEVVRIYNEERPHAELGNITPAQFEEQLSENPVSMVLAMELYDFEQNLSNRFFKAFTKRMDQNMKERLDENTTSLLHSIWTGYSFESCSSAELSSALPDNTNINTNNKNTEISFQQKRNT